MFHKNTLIKPNTINITLNCLFSFPTVYAFYKLYLPNIVTFGYSSCETKAVLFTSFGFKNRVTQHVGKIL